MSAADDIAACERWAEYATTPPPTAGVYRWRVPSQSLPGALVTFDAHFRERGAGYVKALAPVFDRWDGYRVHVPNGTQWMQTDAVCKQHEYANLGLEGLAFSPCLFCGNVPKLKAVEGCSSGGVIIGGRPHRYNSWWLECCSWGRTPHCRDPREMERIRAGALLRAGAEAMRQRDECVRLLRENRDNAQVSTRHDVDCGRAGCYRKEYVQRRAALLASLDKPTGESNEH